jgi:hypothetical protein
VWAQQLHVRPRLFRETQRAGCTRSEGVRIEPGLSTKLQRLAVRTRCLYRRQAADTVHVRTGVDRAIQNYRERSVGVWLDRMTRVPTRSCRRRATPLAGKNYLPEEWPCISQQYGYPLSHAMLRSIQTQQRIQYIGT